MRKPRYFALFLSLIAGFFTAAHPQRFVPGGRVVQYPSGVAGDQSRRPLAASGATRARELAQIAVQSGTARPRDVERLAGAFAGSGEVEPATPVSAAPQSPLAAEATATGFRFASWGDAQDQGTYCYATANKIAAFNPNFTIFNGDFSDDGVILNPATSPDSMQLMSNALRGNPNGLGSYDNGIFQTTLLDRGNHDNHYSNPGDWQVFFTAYSEAQGSMADRVTRVGGREYSYMSGQDNLTYSFDYDNSRFIMVDVPGSSSSLTSAEVTWIDQRLTDAEANHPELVHAFISFHGPLYCVSYHCSCAGQRASCLSTVANSLVSVINKHPIVSALFHGHEHNLGWTHLDNTRISNLTRPVEQFMTSPSGQSTYNQYVRFDSNGVPYRFDYVEASIEDRAFGIVDVNGPSYTVSLYREGRAAPVWSRSFAKPGADITAPSSPAGVAASAVSSSQIDVSWTASTDNVAVAGYRVYRDGVQAGTAPTTFYSDTGLSPATTYSYTVAAYDAAGNVSAQSQSAAATTQPAADTTPPVVAVTSPTNGATVSGVVTVAASASDNTAVGGVQFKADGANVSSEEAVPPYSVSWNTGGYANGTHILTAVARDTSGNTASSAPVTVTVANASAGAGPIVWAEDGMTRIGKTDPARTNSSITLYSARREYEPFQVVIKAPDTNGLSNVNVTMSDLTGPSGATISSDNLTLYREYYVYVTTGSPNSSSGTNHPLGPGWYADGLIPFVDPATNRDLTGALDAAPFAVNAGENQPVWIDVYTPPTVPAGVYTGVVTVSSSQGAQAVAVALNVWNFTLPLVPSLHAYTSLDWSGARNTLTNFEELLRHGLDPEWVSAGDERMLMDNYGFDRTNVLAWSHSSYSHCTPIDPAPAVSTVQAEAAKHQAGLYLFNEYANEVWNCAAQFSTYMQWAANLRAGGVHPLLVTYPVDALMGTDINNTAADIWVMLPKHYDQSKALVDKLVANYPKTEMWIYNPLVQDNYSPKQTIDFLPVNSRIMHGFLNQRLGFTGTKFWRVDYWSGDPWNNKEAYSSDAPGEGDLVYRGDDVGLPNQVIPGMRMKWFREGSEDYEYVQVLKDLGQARFAMDTLGAVVTDLHTWSQNKDSLYAARKALGDKISSLSGSGADTSAPSVPAGVSAVAVSSTQITVSWDPSTDNIGVAGYTISRGGAQVGATAGTVFTDTNLMPSTTYSYTVSAYDSAGNASAGSAPASATTLADPTPDTAPPLISGVHTSNVTSDSAVVSWTTNEVADSQVDYGTSAAYGRGSGDPHLVMSHSLVLSGLQRKTRYHFRVRSSDAAGNMAISSDQTFTTTGKPAKTPRGAYLPESMPLQGNGNREMSGGR